MLTSVAPLSNIRLINIPNDKLKEIASVSLYEKRCNIGIFQGLSCQSVGIILFQITSQYFNGYLYIYAGNVNFFM